MEAQAARLVGTVPLADRWGGALAARFRLDRQRLLEPELALIGGYLVPDDVLLDVGGGAGRVSLPLVGRCREVVNVEPSLGMGAAIEADATARLTAAPAATPGTPSANASASAWRKSSAGPRRSAVGVSSGIWAWSATSSGPN